RRAFDEGGSDVRHYTYTGYKFNDTGYFDERRSHLFVFDLETRQAAQITSGETRNDQDPQWSPDSKWIAFSSEDTNPPVLINHDIWIVASAGGEIRRVNNFDGSARSPRWSPDGKRILYSGTRSEAEMPKLFVAPAAGGDSALLSKDLNIVASDPR